jgi:hypothetical protein
MHDPAACILMCEFAEYGHLLVRLAGRLKRERGAVIHLYCGTPQELAYYRSVNTDGQFASINDANVLYRTIRETPPEENALVAEARGHEAWLGLTINELAIGDRHLGRGYALAGGGHPRSRYSQETNLPKMLHGYNAAIRYWRREVEEKKPTLVLNGGKLQATVAHAAGVPYRCIAPSRYEGYHNWAHNELYENPEVAEVYAAMPAVVGETEIARPYHGHALPRERFLRQANWAGFAREMGLNIARRAYWHLRGFEKARGYYLRENLAYVARKWRDTRRLCAGLPRLADLSGQRFVFYPLQTEPEQSLQTLSPEYFFQLETIAAVARDLPAGVRLAVKETFWSFGRRPSGFYDQITDLKNVVLMDALELGLDVVRQAEATVTITGTAGFEAAVMGKPVITFGRHNLYNMLPHVMVVDRPCDVKAYLGRALDGAIDTSRANADGQRFLKAVIATSFDLGRYDFQEPASITDEAVDNAYRSLLDSVMRTHPAAASRARA